MKITLFINGEIQLRDAVYKPYILKRDLPRYEYQKLRWVKLGHQNMSLNLILEIGLQHCANMTFLFLPALILSQFKQPFISVWEGLGFLLWTLSFALEILVDHQKKIFLKKIET